MSESESWFVVPPDIRIRPAGPSVGAVWNKDGSVTVSVDDVVTTLPDGDAHGRFIFGEQIWDLAKEQQDD